MQGTAAPRWLRRKLGSPDKVRSVGFGPPFRDENLADLRRELDDALRLQGLHLDEIRSKRRTKLTGAAAREYADDPANLQSNRHWWWNPILVWRSPDNQNVVAYWPHPDGTDAVLYGWGPLASPSMASLAAISDRWAG